MYGILGEIEWRSLIKQLYYNYCNDIFIVKEI